MHTYACQLHIPTMCVQRDKPQRKYLQATRQGSLWSILLLHLLGSGLWKVIDVHVSVSIHVYMICMFLFVSAWREYRHIHADVNTNIFAWPKCLSCLLFQVCMCIHMPECLLLCVCVCVYVHSCPHYLHVCIHVCMVVMLAFNFASQKFPSAFHASAHVNIRLAHAHLQWLPHFTLSFQNIFWVNIAVYIYIYIHTHCL